MANKLELFNKNQIKKGAEDIRPGCTVKIYQKIKEGAKGKAQVFEGLVLARKHGKGISSTITVRKIILGVGVEKIFPVHSPNIDKIEIIKSGKVRRSKLYYLKYAKGRKAKLKRKEFKEVIAEETPLKESAPAPEKNTEVNSK